MPHRPLLIAHRGDTAEFPENTMEAFASAFEKGADGIELDVHLNERGEVIVVHNYLYDPKKNYPLLSEVVETFGERGRIEIEVKSLRKECVQKVQEILDRYQLVDYEITSGILPLLPILRQALPQARIGMIFKPSQISDWMTPDFVVEWVLGHLELTRANVLHFDLNLYFPKLLEALKARDCKTHSYLPKINQEIWDRVLALEIDQCAFDDSVILEYRDRFNS